MSRSQSSEEVTNNGEQKSSKKHKRPSGTNYVESSLSESSCTDSRSESESGSSSSSSLREGFVKRSRRRCKEVNYKFNDFDEKIKTAVEQAQDSDWEEEEEVVVKKRKNVGRLNRG